jgi:hypothetical protein
LLLLLLLEELPGEPAFTAPAATLRVRRIFFRVVVIVIITLGCCNTKVANLVCSTNISKAGTNMAGPRGGSCA